MGSTGRCENIIRRTLADHWTVGRERGRLRCEGTGRGQEGCKAEESHGGRWGVVINICYATALGLAQGMACVWLLLPARSMVKRAKESVHQLRV